MLGRGEGGDLKHVDVNLALRALLLGGDAPAARRGGRSRQGGRWR